MNILIIGGNGQLGTELKKQLLSGSSEIGIIPEVYKSAVITSADIDDVDITDLTETMKFFERCHPEIVLNCAAYTNVDGCETHPDDAFRVNAIGARNVAMAAAKIDAKLCHISTDYVYSGDAVQPYSEYDIPAPASVYGKTKLCGEKYAQLLCRKCFIVRTSWLYGYTGKNFVKTILNKARATGLLTVVNDQRGNPTNAVDLAFHILKIAATRDYGIYHCSGRGECSWYEFAKCIIEFAGIPATVTPCTTAEYPTAAPRPLYSSLDHAMLRITVGDEMRDWRDALQCYIKNI